MKNKQTSNFPPLFWCHVQYVFVQICLSCFIMSRVKQAGEGILFGTGDVKNNYLHWSVIFPNEAGNVSGFRATGARLGYFFFFLFGLKTCLSINRASIRGRAVRRRQSSLLSFEQPVQTNSFRLQRWQRSQWTHLWRPSAGRRGVSTTFLHVSSLSLNKWASV